MNSLILSTCHMRQVVVFDRPDLPVPFWRPYLRKKLGVKVLHIYVSVPDLPGHTLDDRTFDWHFTLGFKDCICVICFNTGEYE